MDIISYSVCCWITDTDITHGNSSGLPSCGYTGHSYWQGPCSSKALGHQNDPRWHPRPLVSALPSMVPRAKDINTDPELGPRTETWLLAASLTQTTLTLFFETAFLNEHGAHQLSEASEVQEPSYLKLPSTRAIDTCYCAPQIFMWVMGVWTRVLMLAWRVLTQMNHLPNSKIFTL